jgi:hydrophobic/amphiphilic exporter-1 (mainly G- bacteria), HAE1 family
MRQWVKGAIENSPAMNMLMIAVLVVGMGSLLMMRREVFPEFELEIVLVSVPYPGASPEEVEQGICQKIEEAVQTIEGVKKMTSVANEGAGSVVLELEADVKDVQKVVSEVRSEIERIPSFPELAEDPEVQQITFRESAIALAVLTPLDRPDVNVLELRAVAESVRDQLLQLDSVSQVEVKEVPNYQIDVEVDEATLRKYGLSLQQIAQLIRRENLEVPGGTIKGQGQEILLRGENKRLIGQQIAKLPVITAPGGTVLTLSDIGEVKDELADKSWLSEINGRPALVLDVQRTKNEDLLAMTSEVKNFAAKTQLPAGYELLPWADRSVDVRDRLDLLIENGLMGLLLVFLVLAVFLELKLAFWVALGIPVALLGAGGVLLLADQTLNMLSMFSFLMALGIVVDDAIVVGENIYAHREQGKGDKQAAIDGAAEVMPSVAASVTTTVVAFAPMFFVSGVMGKFIAVMPLAVIAMLMLSLWESLFVLPCHLAHRDSSVFRLLKFFFYPFRFVVSFFSWINRHTARALDWHTRSVYTPVLKFCLRNRGTAVACAVAILFAAVGFVRAGVVPFIVFPKLDSNQIQASVTFPDGTPQTVTNEATRHMVEALHAAAAKLSDKPLIETVYRRVGSGLQSGDAIRGGMGSGGHIGAIEVELVDTSQREVTSQTIVATWREAVGEIPGSDNLTFGTPSFGPGGTPIEFKLLASADNFEQLEMAVEKCKEKLATYDGVFDIDDDSRPGKWEYRVRVKDNAQSLGVSTGDIADTLRANYYGAEVMRLQRGRHEVKLMVRYPEQERRSLANFEDIWIRTNDGQERPIREVASWDVVRGYSEINRVEQKRSITVSADLDEDRGNAAEIVADLRETFMPTLLAEFETVGVRWEGQQEQTQESVASLLRATGVAMLVMFVLLTFEFKSYIQPLLIMFIIPFGLIGAIFGHAIMGLPITLFSFFGLVALTGVVVNDSIVLIDFINHRVRRGEDLDEALIDAGQRRFRPVLLTSATTIAGLLPILLERSFQAQLLIPMATSLSFGLLLTTVLVLLIVPTTYRIYRHWIPFSEDEVEDQPAVVGAKPVPV